MAMFLCFSCVIVYKRSLTFTPPSFAYTGALRPAYVSPMRTVPDHIMRPDYADTGIPASEKVAKANYSVPIYTKKEIEGIREACRIAREILDVGAKLVRPGVTGEEIDIAVHGTRVCAFFFRCLCCSSCCHFFSRIDDMI